MLASPTLLSADSKGSGSFVHWLESLGLEDFLRDYPLPKLIEWGWVVPQYRVVFPKEVFLCLLMSPYEDVQISPELSDYATLWEYSWKVDSDEKKSWFLDGAFREHEPLGALMAQFRCRDGVLALPEAIDTPTAGLMRPYVDFFYRWQGYALVDLIRASACFKSIFSTPDVVERAKNLFEIAEHHHRTVSDWPKGILSHPNRWGGREKLVTALDHFRSFRQAFDAAHESDSDDYLRLYRQGARELAEHFGFTETSLAAEVKDRLLTLASDWMSANRRSDDRARWTQKAWPNLRGEVQLSIIWLLAVGTKSFMDYVDEWQRPFMGNLGWAPLDEALPYEFLAHQKRFTELAPHYLKPFNAALGKRRQLSEERIAKQCRSLQRSNSAFAGFASSFFSLHEELSYRSFDEVGIDFRALRPLDHYAMVAIRAESCLREELRRLGLLDAMPPQKQTLSFYIEAVAKHICVSSKVVGTFMSRRDLSDLKEDRADPIGRIERIETALGESDRMLVQAFLCCTLARNYFAHHDFLDHELLRSAKSEFLMRGIVLTVLTLLVPHEGG